MDRATTGGPPPAANPTKQSEQHARCSLAVEAATPPYNFSAHFGQYAAARRSAMAEHLLLTFKKKG
jgi:hypothetical protein